MSRILRLAHRVRVFTPVRSFTLRTAFLAEGTSAFDADRGSIGSKFRGDGEVGAKVDKEVGGVFARDGAVGKQFDKGGAVGGTADAVVKTAEGEKPSAFDKDGIIGKHFTSDGAVGGTAQAVGGPLAADGVIGKQFTEQGAVGGAVQDNLGDKKPS